MKNWIKNNIVDAISLLIFWTFLLTLLVLVLYVPIIAPLLK